MFIRNSLVLKNNITVATSHFEEMKERDDECSMEWYNSISPSSETMLWCEWYMWISALSSLPPWLIFLLLPPAYSAGAFDVDVRMASKCSEMKLISAGLWLKGTLNVWKALFHSIFFDVRERYAEFWGFCEIIWSLQYKLIYRYAPNYLEYNCSRYIRRLWSFGQRILKWNLKELGTYYSSSLWGKEQRPIGKWF